MIRKLIPVLLALVGLAAGMGGGIVLRPAAEAHALVEGEDHAAPEETDPALLPDYVKLNNQFIVPVLEDGRVVSMVIVSLSLEVQQGSSDQVYAREPKLRDVFLQVMFDHANAGGFRGSFTDGANLVLLREALLEMAQTTLGDIVSDVLIVDIVRQDS
ncbi:MAG: flagellar basal body-associated FliL family protein [Paracoccaceae bacterium]